MNQKINDYIDQHKDEMIEQLRGLIKIRSCASEAKPGMPFGEKSAEALSYALELCDEFGFRTRNVDNYAVRADFGPEDVQLGILTHADIVPEGEGWTYPPFDCVIEDGKMYGRGTTDDKGPLISSIFALRCIKELNIPLKKGVRLIFGGNEEQQSNDLEYYSSIEPMPKMLITPDGEYPVVNVEKGIIRVAFGKSFTASTNEKKVVSVKGGITVNAVPNKATAVVQGFSIEELQGYADNYQGTIKLSFTQDSGSVTILSEGTSAHASKPESGNNALTGLLTFLTMLPIEGEGMQTISEVVKLFPHGDLNGNALGLKDMADLTLTLSIMDYTESNVNIKFDSRFPINFTFEQMSDMFTKAVEKFDFEVSEIMGMGPHSVPEESVLVQTLLKVYHEHTGLKPECLTIGGGTYVHDFEGGVAFGPMFPGVDNRIHGIDEFVDIDEFLLNTKILAHVIMELCG